MGKDKGNSGNLSTGKELAAQVEQERREIAERQKVTDDKLLRDALREVRPESMLE